MRFFTDIMHDPDIDRSEIKARFDAYYQRIESIREQLPVGVYEFAAAPWHYDNGEQGLHDSWVESLIVDEVASEDNLQERSLQIRVRLLSAYQDRRIELYYKNVRKYRLQTPSRFKYPPSYKTGHGDWLYDEIDVSRSGFVVHEVRFSRGSRWLIECEDIEIFFSPASVQIAASCRRDE